MKNTTLIFDNIERKTRKRRASITENTIANTEKNTGTTMRKTQQSDTQKNKKHERLPEAQ